MKIKKTDRIVKEGDPIFEKLKSQMRLDFQKGLKQFVLIGGNKKKKGGSKAQVDGYPQ